MKKWIDVDIYNKEIEINKQLEENLKLPDWLIDLKREQYKKENKEHNLIMLNAKRCR